MENLSRAWGEGAEFKTTVLDDILRTYPKYSDFAKRFVVNRLGSVGLTAKTQKTSSFDPHSCFEEISSSEYYSVAVTRLGLDRSEPGFIKKFIDILTENTNHSISSSEIAKEIVPPLTKDIPLLLQKLNILIFCKKYKRKLSSIALAKKIRSDTLNFIAGNDVERDSYKTAYGHYASDLFAQLCRESHKGVGVPYAGFETFIRMSSGNPRNLLIILGRAYEIAAFKEIDFINGPKLSIVP